MNLRDDVFTVNHDRRTLRRAQCHVQYGALLGDVDLIAAKHRGDSVLKPALFGQLKQKFQSFIGDAILRIIEVNPGHFGCHALAAVGIIREKLPQMKLTELLIMSFERFPGRTSDTAASGGRFDARCHVSAPFGLSCVYALELHPTGGSRQ